MYFLQCGQKINNLFLTVNWEKSQTEPKLKSRIYCFIWETSFELKLRFGSCKLSFLDLMINNAEKRYTFIFYMSWSISRQNEGTHICLCDHCTLGKQKNAIFGELHLRDSLFQHRDLSTSPKHLITVKVPSEYWSSIYVESRKFLICCFRTP